jgi:hypothetical protein
MMQLLSESLEELAARAKMVEESAAATYEADRAQLEKRRQEIDDAFSAELDKFESAMREAADAGRTWCNDTKASMKRPVDDVRARIEQRQSEHEVKRAARVADAAEKDAAAAVEAADYFLNVAEYAVIDAALARLAVDELLASTWVGAPS